MKKGVLFGFISIVFFISSCDEKHEELNFIFEKYEEFEIIDKPVKITEYRKQLMKEYSLKHYGEDFSTIIPQAIIIHWTASNDMMDFYYWANHEESSDEKGTLHEGGQFLVDRDGTIYRLMPECNLARHSIGYNWCAIGIENVGGLNGDENLTEEQFKANVYLIKYLSSKYPLIKYVWGHYQQDQAKSSGLYIEKVAGYHHGKMDPGPLFMKKLRTEFEDSNLVFYKE